MEGKSLYQSGRIHQVPIERIVPNPRQPRRSFDEQALRELAESIQAALNQTVNDRAKEVKAAGGGVYLLKKAEIPAILVECGFLSNSEETVLLNSQAHQNRLAVTILASALAHLNQP